MSADARLRLLSVVLKAFGVLLLALFTTLITLTALDSPLVDDGGALVWMRWQPFSKHVELMLEVVYWVWAVFLLRAARNPLAYLSFLDFTAWANLAHGLLMVVQTFIVAHHMHKLATDDLLTLLLAGLIFWLRPRAAERRVAAAA
jgi:hypothetical protein